MLLQLNLFGFDSYFFYAFYFYSWLLTDSKAHDVTCARAAARAAAQLF